MVRFNGFLEPRYSEAAAKIVEDHKRDDHEALERDSEVFDAIASEASAAFDPRYRKIVGICSRIARNSSIYKALAAEIEPLIEEKMTQDPSRRFGTRAIEVPSGGLSGKTPGARWPRSTRTSSPGSNAMVKQVLDGLERKLLRKQILEHDVRPDGRKSFQIRKLTSEVGLLPKTHGSGLFTRGETQVLTIATLGAHGEKQILDDLGIEEYKSFMHHYNFPPYSTGEARPMRGPKRREIGHGALAERALLPVIPERGGLPLHHQAGF